MAAPRVQRDNMCGRYRLSARIGAGGMGEVFAAADDSIGREVAIKRLRDDRVTQLGIERFYREACVQGRLDHPAIVPVHEIGVDAEGLPFFTMKKLSGTTLAKLITTGHSRPSLLRAFADVCLAIQYAHERGVVHRDLKPSNIVLGDFGEVYIIDWGIAKILATPDAALHTLEESPCGTPGYMAPEQIHATVDVDGRADVYALGSILFEILAGEPLHPRGLPALRSTLHGCDARPSVRATHREIPPELDALCVAATRMQPNARLASARELAGCVQRYLDGDRDLELRRNLARRHLAQARAAFDRLVDRGEGLDEEEQRRIAIRDAARALALDPALAGAAELVGRLMLETPRTLPADVRRRLVDEDRQLTKKQAHDGARAYLLFALMVPIVIAGGLAALPYHALIALAGIINFALQMHPRTMHNAKARLIGSCVLLAVIAHAFSPLLIAPGLAGISVMALTITPTYTRRGTLLAVVLLSGSVFVPWLGELVGILPHTIAMTSESLVLSGPVLAMPLAIKIPVIAVLVLGTVAAGATIAQALRHNDHELRTRLHLQTWQLQQLVPR